MSRGLCALALALAAAAAPALAACGDAEEKNDYVDAVNEVTTSLNSGLTEISSGAAASDTPQEAAAVFSDFATSLDAAAADIDGISPPAGVEGLHDKLVGQVKDLTAAATGAADEIKAGGPASVAGVAAGFISESATLGDDVDATIAEINDKLQE